MSTKTYCGVCDCYVRGDGHDQRCRPKSDSSSSTVWTRERERAWVGDALLLLDVRLAALYLHIERTSMDSFVQGHTSGAAAAQYLLGYVPDSKGEVKRLSTQFEAQYEGLSRERYLRAVFPSVANLIIASWKPCELSVVDACSFELCSDIK